MSKLVSNNTYDGSIHVNWSNKYIKETIFDEETFEDITVWKTSNNQLATSGYYLGVDTKPNSTYIVKLLKLTFDGKGEITNSDTVRGTLYKLPSDFSFQDSAFYYVKNNNNFEELKVNQGQCTFTTNPTTDNNFYIYQKGIEPWTSAPPLPRLVYYYSGTKWYYPLITKTGTLTWNGYIYSYDKSIGDTFGIALNNTKYVVPNKRVAAINYDIPAGTYTPSTFESLIQSFISRNGSRRVNNSFSVEVNGQTYSVSAGRAIYYTYQYSGEARFVCFNGSPRGYVAFEQSFSEGVYCTYWSYSQYQGDRYYQYNIKVNTGISFI